MDRKVPFEPGELYHVYNRGVNKSKIFLSDGDWKYFQRLLYIRNDADGYVRPERVKDSLLSKIHIDKPLVDIQAYALMPNHFHLLISEREKGGVSTFMSRLLTSYSMYINKKYNRSGPLMCRPFRSKHVDNDDYLRWLISYIHLNSLDYVSSDWESGDLRDLEQAKQCVENYVFSSYIDYFGADRDEKAIINPSSLPIGIHELEDIATMLSIYQLQGEHV